MIDERRKVNWVLTLLALVLVVALFGASLLLPGQLGNLMVNLASSVAAVAFWSLFLTINLWVVDGRKRRFFGKDLVDGQTIFVCPDYVVDDQISSAFNNRALIRPGDPSLRADVLPAGDTTRFDIAFATYARVDIEAAMQMATLFEVTRGRSHVVTSDSEIFGDRPRRIMPDLRQGMICIGLTSNDLFLAYMSDPAMSLVQVRVIGGHLTIQPKGRGSYSDDSDRNYGLCVRTRLGEGVNQRYIFFCGGIASAGTMAVVQYLLDSWPKISSQVSTREFVAVISQSSIGGPAELEAVYTR